MSSILFLILNIVFLSTLYACNARLLRFSAIEMGTTKVVEKEQLSRILNQSRLELLQQSNKTKGIEIATHRRKMLGSTSFGDTNETEDDVKEKDNNVEDIVVMDYAQPHRKQPIHN